MENALLLRLQDGEAFELPFITAIRFITDRNLGIEPLSTDNFFNNGMTLLIVLGDLSYLDVKDCVESAHVLPSFELSGRAAFDC
jgi:hypothetical protein